MFFVRRDLGVGLQHQIRERVASAVLAGRLVPGDPLPSSRRLAQHLDVSRITVTLAYQELVADGYLVSQARSGYFVAEAPPVPRLARPVAGGDAGKVDWNRRLGRPFSRIAQVPKPLDWRDYPFPFVYGQADPTLFNHASWRACAMLTLGRRSFFDLSGDTAEADDPALIDHIAKRSLPRRAVAADRTEILVTVGAQNALWLAARLFARPGLRVAIEDPGYPGLRALLASLGLDPIALPVDADGLDPAGLPRELDLVFVTPSHHAPTAATMPFERRIALLERAAADDFIVVEDDYDFETSFVSAPRPALKSLDRQGRVIYAGSFSKSVFPGLRLGYLVAPEPVIREARALRGAVLRHPPGHTQRALAHFLALGHYDALVRRQREAFAARHEALFSAVRAEGLTVAGSSASGGASVWMRAPAEVDTGLLAERLAADGVLIEPGAPFFAADPPRHFYRLAYSAIPAERIPEGVARIARAIAAGAAARPLD